MEVNAKSVKVMRGKAESKTNNDSVKGSKRVKSNAKLSKSKKQKHKKTLSQLTINNKKNDKPRGRKARKTSSVDMVICDGVSSSCCADVAGKGDGHPTSSKRGSETSSKDSRVKKKRKTGCNGFDVQLTHGFVAGSPEINYDDAEGNDDFDLQEALLNDAENDYQDLENLMPLSFADLESLAAEDEDDIQLQTTLAAMFGSPGVGLSYSMWHIVLPALSNHAYRKGKCNIDKQKLLSHVRAVLLELYRSHPGLSIDPLKLSLAVFEETVGVEDLMNVNGADLQEEYSGSIKTHAHILVRYDS